MSTDLSLKQFLHHVVLPRLSDKSGAILEVGCGAYPVLLTMPENHTYSLHALDQLPQEAALGLEFHQANILDQSFIPPTPLVCWFDAHLFHTLTSSADRERYLHQAYKHLLPQDGLFALEMAVASKSTPVWKNLYLRDELPFRFCPDALLMEQMLLEHHFRIEYFRIDSGSRFIFDADRDVVMDADPLRLRALCRPQ